MNPETETALREAEARFVRFERRYVLWQCVKYAVQAVAIFAIAWAIYQLTP